MKVAPFLTGATFLLLEPLGRLELLRGKKLEQVLRDAPPEDGERLLGHLNLSNGRHWNAVVPLDVEEEGNSDDLLETEDWKKHAGDCTRLEASFLQELLRRLNPVHSVNADGLCMYPITVMMENGDEPSLIIKSFRNWTL